MVVLLLALTSLFSIKASAAGCQCEEVGGRRGSDGYLHWDRRTDTPAPEPLEMT
jgi:hypothetical protein